MSFQVTQTQLVTASSTSNVLLKNVIKVVLLTIVITGLILYVIMVQVCQEIMSYYESKKQSLLKKELELLCFEIKNLDQIHNPNAKEKKLLRLDSQIKCYDRMWSSKYIESTFDVKLRPLLHFVENELAGIVKNMQPSQNLMITQEWFMINEETWHCVKIKQFTFKKKTKNESNLTFNLQSLSQSFNESKNDWILYEKHFKRDSNALWIHFRCSSRWNESTGQLQEQYSTILF